MSTPAPEAKEALSKEVPSKEAPSKEAPSVEAQPKDALPKPPYSEIPTHRQYLIRAVVTFIGFLGPLSGNIYLPALPVLSRVFRVSDATINGTVSVFMAVFAVAPLVWAAQVHLGGRRPLYLASTLIFIVANVILAAVPAHIAVLYVFRVVQAFGASCAISMGAGTIADITVPAKRAFAMSLFLLGPQIGPIVGPVIGGAFAGTGNWRWIFGFLAILSFLAWLMVWFFLPETLRYRVGNGAVYKGTSFFLFPPTPLSKLLPDDKRPPKPPRLTLKVLWKLVIYPPIGIVSINSALLFAGFYGIATSQPHILESEYHWSTVEVGLAYLAPGLAMMSGSLASGRVSDWHRKRLVAASSDGKVAPETRLSLQIWGVFVAAAGTLIYGWTTQYHIHPAVVLLAAALAGGGMSWVFVTSTSYCTEISPTQPAAVVALGNMLRNPAAAVAAAIIDPLIRAMGRGWCFTGLALLELFVVGGLLMLVRFKGPSWRQSK